MASALGGLLALGLLAVIIGVLYSLGGAEDDVSLPERGVRGD